MRMYGLQEFAFLIGMGLWNGGVVQGLGHVAAARGHAEELPMAGLCGLALGAGVMLEKNAPGVCGGWELVLSVYDPYAGGYRFCEVSADFDMSGMPDRAMTQREVEKALAQIPGQEVGDGGSKRRVSKEYTSLRDLKRYEASYSSYRTGRIPTSKRR